MRSQQRGAFIQLGVHGFQGSSVRLPPSACQGVCRPAWQPPASPVAGLAGAGLLVGVGGTSSGMMRLTLFLSSYWPFLSFSTPTLILAPA